MFYPLPYDRTPDELQEHHYAHQDLGRYKQTDSGLRVVIPREGCMDSSMSLARDWCTCYG